MPWVQRTFIRQKEKRPDDHARTRLIGQSVSNRFVILTCPVQSFRSGGAFAVMPLRRRKAQMG
jgi:hypothetical protein